MSWAPGERERYLAWSVSRANRIRARVVLETMMAGDPGAYAAAVDRIEALYAPTNYWRVEEEPEFPDSRIVVNQNIW